MKRVIISLAVALLVLMNVRTWAAPVGTKSMSVKLARAQKSLQTQKSTQPGMLVVDMSRHVGNTKYMDMKSRFEKQFDVFRKSTACNEISLQMMADLVNAESKVVDALLASAPVVHVKKCKEERNWLLESTPRTVVNLFDSLMDVATASKAASRLTVDMLPRKTARSFLIDMQQNLCCYGRVVKTVQKSLSGKNTEISQSVDAGGNNVVQFSPVVW